jgi:hypothetical protein
MSCGVWIVQNSSEVSVNFSIYFSFYNLLTSFNITQTFKTKSFPSLPVTFKRPRCHHLILSQLCERCVCRQHRKYSFQLITHSPYGFETHLDCLRTKPNNIHLVRNKKTNISVHTCQSYAQIGEVEEEEGNETNKESGWLIKTFFHYELFNPSSSLSCTRSQSQSAYITHEKCMKNSIAALASRCDTRYAHMFPTRHIAKDFKIYFKLS